MDRGDWDERYATSELLWRAEPNQFLVAEVADITPGRALDLACGEGRNALWLAAKGWDTVGVDFSAVGLAKARRLAKERGLQVRWIEADVVEWEPPAAAFDLVIVMYLQLGPPARRAALHRATSALAPGGVLLVVGHDAANLTEGVGGPQDPQVLYTPKDIVGDLSGVRIVRAEQVRRVVATDAGEAEAIDALVRAARPT